MFVGFLVLDGNIPKPLGFFDGTGIVFLRRAFRSWSKLEQKSKRWEDVDQYHFKKRTCNGNGANSACKEYKPYNTCNLSKLG